MYNIQLLLTRFTHGDIIEQNSVIVEANMARKSKFDGGTKNKLIEVGTRLFFEKGFDGTSIRNIADETGCEVGLFYYYYKTKDDLFSDILEHFFEPYKKDFQAIVDGIKENSDRALERFFKYMQEKVRDFRVKYESNMHRTVRWAIREQSLTVIEPYIEQIIKILIADGANPPMDARLTAVFLAHGVGSVILHEDADWVDEVTPQLRKTVNFITGIPENKRKEMFGY